MKLLPDHEDEIYCRPFYLKAQLVKRYGDDIFFAEINGKHDVVCFKDTASLIISDEWYKKRNIDSDDDSKWII